jgi:hypothetical protein
MPNPSPASYAYAVYVAAAANSDFGIEGATFAGATWFDVLEGGWLISGGGAGLYLLDPPGTQSSLNLSQVTVAAPGYQPRALSPANTTQSTRSLIIYTQDADGNFVWRSIPSWYTVLLSPAIVATPAPTGGGQPPYIPNILVQPTILAASLSTDPSQPNTLPPATGQPNTPDNLLHLEVVFYFSPLPGQTYMGQPVPVGPLPWSVQDTIPFTFTTSDGYTVSGTVAPNDAGLPTVPLTWDSSTSSYLISHDFLASYAEGMSPIATDPNTGCIAVQTNPSLWSLSGIQGRALFGYEFNPSNAVGGKVVPLDNNQMAAASASLACSASW